MNLRGDSTIAISLVAAAILWAAATLLESVLSDRRANEAEGGARATFPTPARPDSSVQVNVPHQGCAGSEQALRDLVDDSQACATDDDCTIFDYGYPIQCMTSINKDRIPAIRESYAVYEQDCEYRVYYDCPSEPLVRVPLCRANRCVVELHTVDDLIKEETLDHIGNRPRSGRSMPEI